MNRQTLIALGVALILGLVAVYLVNTVLTASQRRNEAEHLTRVAVATVPLGFGTEITADKVRFASYPSTSLPAGSFTDISQLLPEGQRRVALLPIAANEPILADKISGAGRNAGIAALLPDGMRAATVRINDVSGVAGFIQPNDSVDILITREYAGGNNNNSQQITDVLLQDVRVIAIGQNNYGADGKPISASTATFEVDPLGAQKLALGQEVGSLSLVLRKPGQDQDTPLAPTVSLNDLRYNVIRGVARPVVTPGAPVTVTRSAPRPTPRPARKAPPPPSGSKIDVVRGTNSNEYQVGNYVG